MEFLTEFSNYLNEIILLVTAVFGAIMLAIRSLISRIGFALLAGLGRGAGAGLGGKLAGAQGSASMGSRRMPSSPRARQARQALWQAAARERRMQIYLDAWAELLSLKGGPFALSTYLLSLLEKGFQEKILRLQRRCREFDRLEDRAQRILQRYEADYERKCEPIRDEMLDDEVELIQWKARLKRWRFKFWKKRWRFYKSKILAVRKRLYYRKTLLFRREYRLNVGYRFLLEPALRAADQYENTYLSHWVHSFEADLKSFYLTVLSGRLIDILNAEQNSRLKLSLGLDQLPTESEQLGDFLRRALDGYEIGYGPETTLESLFETYLRAILLQDNKLCLKWGINPIWLEKHLPAPGSLGVCQERYDHLRSEGDWRSQSQIESGKFKTSKSAA